MLAQEAMQDEPRSDGRHGPLMWSRSIPLARVETFSNFRSEAPGVESTSSASGTASAFERRPQSLTSNSKLVLHHLRGRSGLGGDGNHHPVINLHDCPFIDLKTQKSGVVQARPERVVFSSFGPFRGHLGDTLSVWFEGAIS